jgi:hypothetical protein
MSWYQQYIHTSVRVSDPSVLSQLTDVDESAHSANLRVKEYLKDEAEELLKGRFRIIK